MVQDSKNITVPHVFMEQEKGFISWNDEKLNSLFWSSSYLPTTIFLVNCTVELCFVELKDAWKKCGRDWSSN